MKSGKQKIWLLANKSYRYSSHCRLPETKPFICPLTSCVKYFSDVRNGNNLNIQSLSRLCGYRGSKGTAVKLEVFCFFISFRRYCVQALLSNTRLEKFKWLYKLSPVILAYENCNYWLSSSFKIQRVNVGFLF